MARQLLSSSVARVVVTALVAAGCPGVVATAGQMPTGEVSVTTKPATPPDESRYVNREVPDLLVRTSAGARRLSELWHEGPVVLTLVFARCAGVCSPYLRSLRAADQAIDAPDVHRVILSFDPRDTVADMEGTARHLGVFGHDRWTVGVADPADIERLSQALGFWFAWDEGRQQFDHPAMLAAIRRGRVARVLVGESITPARLAEVVREGRGEFVASYPLPGATRWRCFDYDPATGRASLSWGALLLILPAMVAMVFTLAMFRSGRRSARIVGE